jgi:hypothetical protein
MIGAVAGIGRLIARLVRAVVVARLGAAIIGGDRLGVRSGASVGATALLGRGGRQRLQQQQQRDERVDERGDIATNGRDLCVSRIVDVGPSKIHR